MNILKVKVDQYYGTPWNVRLGYWQVNFLNVGHIWEELRNKIYIKNLKTKGAMLSSRAGWTELNEIICVLDTVCVHICTCDYDHFTSTCTVKFGIHVVTSYFKIEHACCNPVQIPSYQMVFWPSFHICVDMVDKGYYGPRYHRPDT